MSEPPDKTRVIRLVKKTQQTAPKPSSGSPPSSASADPQRPAGTTRRFDRASQHIERPAWRKGPPKRTKNPRQPYKPSHPPKPPAPSRPVPVALTEEQRSNILNLYREMVVRDDRPPEGRRAKIAGALNIPYSIVAEVVRGYVTHERYRRTNFDIERQYWQSVRSGVTNARSIAHQIAGQLQLDEGRVWWWLEKLHEPRKSFVNDPELEEAKQAAILELYEAYLQRTDPPEKGLHQWLAEQIGDLTPRQVHKTLWTYRLATWQALEGTETEPVSGSKSEQLLG